jgi:hypothetical protein
MGSRSPATTSTPPVARSERHPHTTIAVIAKLKILKYFFRTLTQCVVISSAEVSSFEECPPKLVINVSYNINEHGG